MAQDPVVYFSPKAKAGALLGMFLAALGLDFLCHAGLLAHYLAHYYVKTGPSLLFCWSLVSPLVFSCK